MSLSRTELTVAFIALIAAVAAAALAIVFDGELELTFFMAAAVVAALACFEAALDRNANAFWPWFASTLAVLAKAVPTVVYELADDDGLAFERYDHLGTVLAGLAIALALIPLVVSATSTRRTAATAALILAAGVVAGAAGATVGFVYEPEFETELAARVFETGGWAIVGLVLCEVALATTARPIITGPVFALLAAALGVAALNSLAAAGFEFELGWWAVVFAALTLGAAGFRQRGLAPGRRSHRSAGPMMVAMVVATAGACAAVWALVDGSRWDPGWIVLVASAATAFVLAPLMWPPPLASRGVAPTALRPGSPIGVEADLSGSGPTPSGSELGTPESRLAATLAASSRIGASASTSYEHGSEVANEPTPKLELVPDPAAAGGVSDSGAAGDVQEEVSDTGDVGDGQEEVSDPGDSGPVTEEVSDTGDDGEALVGVTGTSGGGEALVGVTDTSGGGDLREDVSDTGDGGEVDVGVSDTGGLAPSHAPLAELRPHHIDPPTDLLSAAGLQLVINTLFATPRQAGQVALLMVAVRNDGSIERHHGRVASAEITSTVAERLRSLVPDGIAARFARAAFAVVLDDQGSPDETIDRFTSVLVALLEPVPFGGATIEIDVVGGMAQCYAGEDAAAFVNRANLGLERAVQSPEPTLVAMP